MKKYGIILLTILALILAGTLYWLNKDNTVSVTTEEKTTLSPTQVESIEAIGEWEFLAISNEELVDTVRHGFFGDDQLVRIYYGTLRLGINMKEAHEGWIVMDGDTVKATLPPVRLLDQSFIDETRTRSFIESGKWSHKDREQMYRRADAMMRRRCLTPANIRNAQQNAKQQFRSMLQSMGYENVKVEIAN